MKTLDEEYKDVANKYGEQISEKLKQAADLILEAQKIAKENLSVNYLCTGGDYIISIQGIDGNQLSTELFIEDVIDDGPLISALDKAGWNTSSMSC